MWWDEEIGQGNKFQDLLIEPAQDLLLDVRPGQVLLDIACGAGRYTRRVAEQGAEVVAFDLSEVFLNRARERTSDDAKIEYHNIDATDCDAISGLGERRFDAALRLMPNSRRSSETFTCLSVSSDSMSHCSMIFTRSVRHRTWGAAHAEVASGFKVRPTVTTMLVATAATLRVFEGKSPAEQPGGRCDLSLPYPNRPVM